MAHRNSVLVELKHAVIALDDAVEERKVLFPFEVPLTLTTRKKEFQDQHGASVSSTS